MYEAGRGAPVDLVAAYAWYSLAIRGGSEHSGHGQAIVREDMTPAQIAEAERRIKAFRPQPEATLVKSGSSGKVAI